MHSRLKLGVAALGHPIPVLSFVVDLTSRAAGMSFSTTFHNVMEVHLVGGTIENQYGTVDMTLGEFELLYCRYST